MLYVADHTADGVSSMASLIRIFGPHATPFLLVFAGISALVAAWYFDRNLRLKLGMMLKIPQLIILILISLGSIEYSYHQHFADGVQRGFYFIFIDQIYPIVLTLIYAFSL